MFIYSILKGTKLTYKDNWKKAKCSCTAFYKKYMCEHILSIAFTMKILSPTSLDKAKIVIGAAAKRGAKSKAKPALTMQ